MAKKQKSKSTEVVVVLPDQLHADLNEVLSARGMAIQDVVRLYLRSLVTAAQRMKALTLADEMPIGKFRGETIEVVVRAEPRYVLWLSANVDSFKLDPEVLSLIEELA